MLDESRDELGKAWAEVVVVLPDLEVGMVRDGQLFVGVPVQDAATDVQKDEYLVFFLQLVLKLRQSQVFAQ